jgi:hypothetical protein
LDYAVPKYLDTEWLSRVIWDLDIIQLLLRSGCNPNQAFEEETSPWQCILGFVQRKLPAEGFCVKAENFGIYFRVGRTRPKTSCSTYLGSLFELMLKHGADPYARIMESPVGKSKPFSVYEIISGSLAASPMDVAVLVKLLPKQSLLPELPLSRESQLARLKRKLGFANKA